MHPSHDTAQDIAQLFRMYIGNAPRTQWSILGSLLTQRESLEQAFAVMLELQSIGDAERAGIPSAVIASQFCKYYCRCLCGALYAMSRCGQLVDLNPAHMAVGFIRDEGPCVIVGEPTAGGTALWPEGWPEWRDTILQKMFSQNVQPLFSALTRYYHVSPNLLWENCVIYIHYFYKEWIREAAEPEDRARLEADYRYIVEEAPPELFGVSGGNPLHIQGTYVTNPDHPDGKLRIRKTCCLRNRLPNAAACSTCPSSCNL
jgi:siderophore-iron reductase FhuF